MRLEGATGWLLGGLLIMTLAGCWLVVGAAGGAAGAIYVKGRLKDRFDAPVARVHEAPRAALKEMGLSLHEDKADQLSAQVESKFADGTRVWVTINADGNESSKISIRVGVMGDEGRSRAILDSIKKHLPSPAS
jgi:hypothetical protein